VRWAVLASLPVSSATMPPLLKFFSSLGIRTGDDQPQAVALLYPAREEHKSIEFIAADLESEAAR
jgi:hypothetical protein